MHPMWLSKSRKNEIRELIGCTFSSNLSIFILKNWTNYEHFNFEIWVPRTFDAVSFSLLFYAFLPFIIFGHFYFPFFWITFPFFRTFHMKARKDRKKITIFIKIKLYLWKNKNWPIHSVYRTNRDYNTRKIFRCVGEGTLPWATPCLGPSRSFFKWEENKYFSPYAYCFIFKSDLLNSNFVEKNSYFILFFLESYFL